MSTPAKVEHGVKEERDAGTTPLKARLRSEEDQRGSGTTTPMKIRRVVKEELRGSATTPAVNVVLGVIKEEEKVMGTTPVNVVGAVESKENSTVKSHVKVEREVKEEKDTAPMPVKLENHERSTATSKVKAEAGRGGTHIEIKVWSLTAKAEDVVSFRIRRDVEMWRLMDMYCEKHSIHSRSDVYFVDSVARGIQSYKTPDEIGLEDGDANVFPVLTEN